MDADDDRRLVKRLRAGLAALGWTVLLAASAPAATLHVVLTAAAVPARVAPVPSLGASASAIFSAPPGAISVSPALASLSEGPPARLGASLPREQYAVIAAKRLANPRLLWVNRDYLRENGFALSDNGVAPEMETQLLDALAYGIPGKDEPAAAFRGETKLFYADRYGGTGIGENLGSGRAASAGRIQLKGIGRTPLVQGVCARDDHSNGLVRLEEAMREAFWGELNQQLPHGANRVIALIDRGTRSRSPGGTEEPNVIVVREDPVRPAHFMELPSVPADGGADRLEFARRLARSLPVPAGMDGAPLAERIGAGLGAYVDRVARQYAAAFARKLYHGATSESNIELSGRFLDYGTETAVPGYGKLHVLPSVEPAGATDGLKFHLVQNPIASFSEKLPPSLAGQLPGIDAYGARFDESYREALSREFVRLTGVPEELAKPLEGTNEAQALGKLLPRVAVTGAKDVIGKYSVPERLTRYDLSAILVALAARRSADATVLERALRKRFAWPAASSVPRRIARAYAAYMTLVVAEARSRGIATDGLRRGVARNAQARNRSLPGAYRWKMMDEHTALIEEYARNPDPALIQSALDARIAASKR